MNIACSRGCFICSNKGDGPATGRNQHDSSCCKSTACNSRAWDQQCAKWLLAEQLYVAQYESWLAAEQQHQAACQEWLDAQQQFRSTLRMKSVKRVRVQAAPATPQTVKARAHAR